MKILEIISGIYGKIHLDEVSMKPAHLEKWAASPETEGMLMGIEFELYFPNATTSSSSQNNVRVYHIDDIVNFFEEYEDGDRLRAILFEKFLEWVDEQIYDNIDYDAVKERIAEDYDIDDFMEDAKKQLEDDENSTEEDIKKLAEKMMKEAIQESFENQDSYYDDAFQEQFDNLRDDFYQSDWLDSVGVSTAQDAANQFGLYWPYDEGGERSIDDIADLLQNELGYSTVASKSYHANKKDITKWYVEPDGSLDEPNDNDDAGIEIVSAALPINEMVSEIDKFVGWAKKHGCYTNDTTGLHMNISVPNFSKENLDYVKLALFMGDEYVLNQFERYTNTFCSPAIENIKSANNANDIVKILDKMRQQLNSSTSKLIYNVNTEKRVSINAHSDRVEFRGPGGDWLNQDVKKLALTVMRLAMALKIACDENAHKQEYAKKLYKFLSKGSENLPTINLISLYSAGLIDKEDLISRLQQAWSKPQTYMMKDPKAAYEYARNVKGPWPEAEPYIVKDPKYAQLYAKHVLKDIQPETWAERFKHGVYKHDDISKNPAKLLAIAKKSGKRWPDAEPIIMRYPEYAVEYTVRVINARRDANRKPEQWTEAEPYIMKDPEYAHSYAYNVIQGRWPEAEKYIMQNPKYAYLYTKNVINGKRHSDYIRWPEAEPYIANDPIVSLSYAKDILKDPDPKTWGERYLQGKVK